MFKKEKNAPSKTSVEGEDVRMSGLETNSAVNKGKTKFRRVLSKRKKGEGHFIVSKFLHFFGKHFFDGDV